MYKFKKQIITSAISLILCLSMFLGTTYAWFTDSVTSSNNIITSGTLDAEMYYSDTLLPADSAEWQNADGKAVFTYDKWEPNYTDVKYIKITNVGNLSFKWKLTIEKVGSMTDLAEVIEVFYINPVSAKLESLDGLTSDGLLSDVVANHTATEGVLLPVGTTETGLITGEIILAVALHMDMNAGNHYQDKSIGDGFALNLIATQYSYEGDAFDNTYDEESTWPNTVIINQNSAVAPITKDAEGKISAPVTLTSADGFIQGNIPSGVLMEDGATEATLRIGQMEKSKANITLDRNEATLSMDVHIDGVSEDNEVVMEITINKLLPLGLNMGNYRFYHVEDGVTVEMNLLADGATPVHNDFTYDSNTGDVTLYLKSFSEVALAVDTTSKWNGGYDYSWYDPSKTELTIANADQLAAFGAIVGGMAEGIAQDSFAGKTVTLLTDIDLGDKESANNPDLLFYPIGYYNSTGSYSKVSGGEVSSGFKTFEGTFDGNGNIIANFYQNTWEMFGDYNDGYSGTPNHYRDGMGLFGKVYGGTVKNLTVMNFSSDGEYTTTGVVAAYADFGATFENIAIIHCNPRVYNIGNGGIVGAAGWYTEGTTDKKITFTNITVDNSNKISALWGSWDVACGGIIGQYYPTSGQTSAGSPANAGVHFENCHVSAQIDVYNDVCANYQYYAYRYAGMIIGSIRENETIDGRVYPKMDGITANDCTVHFGTWNDYYYCELVANSLASYTHDHQMSRLTQVKSVDIENKQFTDLNGNTKAIPATGRVNYVVVNGEHSTENATCYHFVDGEVWHHENAGTETVSGKTVLKEDKQHIYLEFNNLFTGYGWGVTSKGLADYEGVENMEITLGQEASETKFEAVTLNPDVHYCPDPEYVVYVKELFRSIVDDEKIDTQNVHVFASPLGGGSASGVYTPNDNDWRESTIALSGKGTVKIVITDYKYCIETYITIILEEKPTIEMPWV